MKDYYYNNSKDYINRWVISYADLVTLLLALFLVMFAVNNAKLKTEANSGLNINNHQAKVVSMPNLEKELLREFKNEENVELLKDPRGLILRLSDNMLFGEAESEIQVSSYETLNKIIDILSKNDNPVIIEGHTDSLPIKSEKYSSNWELSTARAISVINYIENSHRISPKRLSAVGYGDNLPIAENTSNSGRLKNRRVDIIILSK